MPGLEKSVVRGLRLAWDELGPLFQDFAKLVEVGVQKLLEDIGFNLLRKMGDFFKPLFTGDFTAFMDNLRQLNDWLDDVGVYDAVLEIINATLGIFGFAAA
jgi:hypothetical protein